METRNIPVEDIYPNNWNPNRQKQTTFEKEKASIKRFGMIDPLLVRDLTVDGVPRFEIIDGEHRWRASKDVGLEEIPCVITNFDDETAKRLTITMNELRGDADPILLSEMLLSLKETVDVEDLLSTMPWSENQLQNILEVAEIDLEALATDDIVLPGEGDTDEWVSLAAIFGRKQMPRDAAVLVESEVDRLSGYYGLTRANRFQALEIMAAHSAQTPLEEADPRAKVKGLEEDA
jgi:ParB/RepB/Spo0J family partition protein